MRFVDPSGLIIELAGTEEEQLTLLYYLNQLTDHTLGVSLSGRVTLQYRASSDLQFEYGNTLIERLMAADHVVTIHLFSGASEFRADCRHEAAMTPGLGSGGIVRFNPANALTRTTVSINPSTGLAENEIGMYAHIVLGHELIHADRSMRGVMLPHASTALYSFEAARLRFSPARITGGSTRTVTHRIRVEELATIGLARYTSMCITENMIRQEHGIARRGSHLARV